MSASLRDWGGPSNLLPWLNCLLRGRRARVAAVPETLETLQTLHWTSIRRHASRACYLTEKQHLRRCFAGRLIMTTSVLNASPMLLLSPKESPLFPSTLAVRAALGLTRLPRHLEAPLASHDDSMSLSESKATLQHRRI